MKRFILVAGVDYNFMKRDFGVLCYNRMKRILLRNSAKEDMIFMIFDFRKGEIATHEITYPDGKQMIKISMPKPSPFKSISSANYETVSENGETHHRFKNGQHWTLSILDVYKAVQKIGIDAPGTLVELSFFSHAYLLGPILVNSYEDNEHSRSGGRDPDDMDPRAAKDFIAPTMDDAALRNFQKAFHRDGYSWIWGCTFNRIVHEILCKIETNQSYKNSGIGDDEIFTIRNLSTKQADKLDKFFGQVIRLVLPDKRNIEIEFKFLKYFFCWVTVGSYIHKLAKNSNVKAYGAVVGTYSIFESEIHPPPPLPLMQVCTEGFARHFAFYKNYLGFNFDPERKMYGECRPEFSCTVPT